MGFFSYPQMRETWTVVLCMQDWSNCVHILVKAISFAKSFRAYETVVSTRENIPLCIQASRQVRSSSNSSTCGAISKEQVWASGAFSVRDDQQPLHLNIDKALEGTSIHSNHFLCNLMIQHGLSTVIWRMHNWTMPSAEQLVCTADIRLAWRIERSVANGSPANRSSFEIVGSVRRNRPSWLMPQPWSYRLHSLET